MKRLAPFLAVTALSGCCKWDETPSWDLPEDLTLEDDVEGYDLNEWVVDDRGYLEFDVSSNTSDIIAWNEDELLKLESQPDFTGTATVTLTVRDRCDQEATGELLEGRLTATMARLLDIGATTSRVRRQLMHEPEVAHSADELVERLRREASAAARARQELGGGKG